MDATRRLLLFFDTADQDPVLQWTEFIVDLLAPLWCGEALTHILGQ